MYALYGPEFSTFLEKGGIFDNLQLKWPHWGTFNLNKIVHLTRHPLKKRSPNHLDTMKSIL